MAELQQNLNLDAALLKGRGGVFDVVLDGHLVFSKKHVGRFPEPGEVTASIRKQLEAAP